MTYRSRNRSLAEVLVAVVFVCFMVGFIGVLCIGNYYRAKKAMERQRQRRLARLAGNAGNGVVGLTNNNNVKYNGVAAQSPNSTVSGSSGAISTDDEQRNLVGGSGGSAISHRQKRDIVVDLM